MREQSVSTIVFITLALVMFETPRLRSYALYFFDECGDAVIEYYCSFDCFASLARNLSNAFSTESLLISAMTAVPLEDKNDPAIEIVRLDEPFARPDKAASPS